MTIWASLREEAKASIRAHEEKAGRIRNIQCLVLALIFLPRQSLPLFVRYLGRQFGRLFDLIVNRRYFS